MRIVEMSLIVDSIVTRDIRVYMKIRQRLRSEINCRVDSNRGV